VKLEQNKEKADWILTPNKIYFLFGRRTE